MNNKSVEELSKTEKWEKRAESFSAIFDFLKTKGLKENELIKFTELLNIYLSLL
ncbi:hypothetical protein [Clostridium sp. DL1XJH146]